ncbi:MAG: lipocalin-like domain-containing protein [Pseudomonadota bacterium]
MFGKVFVTFLILTLSAAHAKEQIASAGSKNNPLVGSWRLVSYTDTPKGGKALKAFGESPIGQFVFTDDGHISVHLMHNPPAPKNADVDPDPDACVPAWYCAYFGTYAYNAGDSTWTTRVVGGNIVTYIGTDQKRKFTIKDGRLIISETYTVDGVSYFGERILVRSTRVEK